MIARCTEGHEGDCWNAKEHECVCACGGRFHGIGNGFGLYAETEKWYESEIKRLEDEQRIKRGGEWK